MKDFSSDPVTLGVVGAGVMGRGIAQTAAVAGIDVLLHDADAGAVTAAVQFVHGMLDRAVEKGRMERAAADVAAARIRDAGGLAALADCDVIIEAIVEKLEVKQSLFRELEALARADCILATNTSSLSVTAIAAGLDSPARVAGCHFFNPVPLMKLVEVIAGQRTGAEVIDRLEQLARRFGHTPVRVTDSPGFLVNHVGRGLITEGLRILHESVTDAVTVDRIMRDCAGFRMGPFELMDLTGLDVTFPASEQVYNQYFQEPRLRPTPLQRRRFLAGLLGRKTGEGFYRYQDGKKIEAPEAPAPSGPGGASFWVSRTAPDAGEALRALIAQGGGSLDDGARPAADSIALLTPLGWDATTAAVHEGVDPRRTLAVDMAFCSEVRVTLMRTPATEQAVVDAAHAVLAQTGRAVSVIRDSGGFVAQRIAATIINIACDIAQQGIARPGDIDTAAQLGLGYPRGPLALGDDMGAERVRTILESLLALYGDPRYRPSPWLRRRAQLGLSLLHEEA